MSCLVLGFLVGFVMLILNTMLMFGSALSLPLVLVKPGHGMGAFLRVVPVPDSVFCAGGGRGSGAVDSHVHIFVADVIKSFDTVDRGVLDAVLSSLGLPGWFRHAYFGYQSCLLWVSCSCSFAI